MQGRRRDGPGRGRVDIQDAEEERGRGGRLSAHAAWPGTAASCWVQALELGAKRGINIVTAPRACAASQGAVVNRGRAGFSIDVR